MDLRYSFFVVLLWIFIVTVHGKGTLTDVVKKNDTCYKPCRVKSGPVCGNDGRNYSTGCHLSIARCRARRIGQRIYVLNTGFCVSSKPLSPCSLDCTDRRQPVCASDKVTYKNICLFKKAKCEKRKKKQDVITVINRRGGCGGKVKPKSKACRDLKTCPKVKRQVCGSNNKTYQNICHLKTANCVMKRKARGKKVQKLSLQYCGVCGQIRRCSSSWQSKCPPIKLCDQMLKATKQGSRAGTGKNNGKGKTKRSPSLKGKKNRALKKTKSKVGKKGPILKWRKRFMVCGSDGKTYRSICHLQVTQCNKKKKCQQLQMRSKGPCKRRRS